MTQVSIRRINFYALEKKSLEKYPFEWPYYKYPSRKKPLDKSANALRGSFPLSLKLREEGFLLGVAGIISC